MSRRVGMVCAGAMLLAIAGCSLAPFLLPFGAWGPEQVVVGTVDEVSGRIQATLREEGINMATNLQGEDFRMAGQSKSGAVFCLHLTRVKAPGEKKTRVALQWDREADPDFLPLLARALAAPTPVADEAE